MDVERVDDLSLTHGFGAVVHWSPADGDFLVLIAAPLVSNLEKWEIGGVYFRLEEFHVPI